MRAALSAVRTALNSVARLAVLSVDHWEMWMAGRLGLMSTEQTGWQRAVQSACLLVVSLGDLLVAQWVRY